jgi:DNA-directed RNA polymerase subunit RPC12/RpoP
MIRFSCPSCQKALKAPEEGAGRKISCPNCGQRLLIPSPPSPPVHAQDKTILGAPLPDWANPSSISPVEPGPEIGPANQKGQAIFGEDDKIQSARPKPYYRGEQATPQPPETLAIPAEEDDKWGQLEY